MYFKGIKKLAQYSFFLSSDMQLLYGKDPCEFDLLCLRIVIFINILSSLKKEGKASHDRGLGFWIHLEESYQNGCFLRWLLASK